MALLTGPEVQAYYEKPKAQELKDAHAHELRLRLHTNPSVVKLRDVNNRAWGRFLSDYPAALLPQDKYETFLSLVTWPLSTTETVAAVYDELSKIFDGQNKVKDVFFSDAELQNDFQEYLKQINEPKFWKTIGWDIYKNHINAVLVVDMPAGMVTAGRPEPYFYWVATEKIICIENNEHGECEFILFKTYPTKEDYEAIEAAGMNRGKLEYCVIALDEGFYRKYYKLEGNQNLLLISENPHSLGYTPARSFWSQPLGDCHFQRENQVTYNLGALDWLLFSQVSKRHVDLINGFPIMSIYEQDCDYLTEDGFWRCDGNGQLVPEPGAPEEAVKNKATKPCPNCAIKNLVGAGNVVTVPAPREAGDPSLMPSVMLTSADINNLKHVTEDIDRQIAEIMVHTVGFGGEPVNDQAKNEKQVNSSFESRMTIINQVKENFEIINKWVVDTIGKLRYGDNYAGSAINYGTKFYLLSENEMVTNYQASKDAGLPMFELQNNRRDIYKKKYKNDPEQLTRIIILENIEPYTDLTVDQLREVDYVDPTQYAIKVNFNDLLQRFEREFGNVVTWMPEMELNQKVDLITEQFVVYLNEAELLSEEPELEPPAAPGTEEGEE